MFSTQWSVSELAKRQFLFKLHANGAIFTLLIVLQIISTVFIGGATTSSTAYDDGMGPLLFNYSTISNDGQIGLTLFWALIIGFLLTSAAQRNESFAFVTNRLTFQLANFYFLCTAALFGAVTSVSLGATMKILTMLGGGFVMETTAFAFSPLHFSTQIFVMTAYSLLLMLISYTLGSLIQFNRLFILLFAVIWGVFTQTPFLIVGENGDGLLNFFFQETSIILFALKVLVTSAALFGISFWVTNRLEVRNS